MATLAFIAIGCASTAPDEPPPPGGGKPPDGAPTYVVVLEMSATAILAGHEVELTARVTPAYDGLVTWSAPHGTLEASGTHTAVFRPPPAKGTYAVTATLSDAARTNASATVDVTGGLLEPFAITVVPDTQGMVNSSHRAWMIPEMFEWIVANRDDRAIEFVTHVGDVVWNPDNDGQWRRALAGIDLLDDVVPYSIALGDHEYFPEEDKGGSTEAYRSHFGPERYADYGWYVGAHGDGLSHAQLFKAGGREFLHVALEWEPTGSVGDPTTPLGWAASVLAAHPRVPTLITTHAYLWDEPGAEGRFPREAREGTVTVGGVATYVGASGEDLFVDLIAPNPQVFMVLSGHYHRAALPDKGKYHQISLNEAGLEVYEMLSNFQSWPNGGQGWLRLIDFVPGGGADGHDRIAVSTYSPVLDREGEHPFQDDPRGAFTFDLDFAQRFADY